MPIKCAICLASKLFSFEYFLPSVLFIITMEIMVECVPYISEHNCQNKILFFYSRNTSINTQSNEYKIYCSHRFPFHFCLQTLFIILYHFMYGIRTFVYSIHRWLYFCEYNSAGVVIFFIDLPFVYRKHNV